MNPLKHLQAVVFDWAGTIIDHGSCAPASVFQEIFQQEGVSISIAHARGPMGKAKRDHIASIAQYPEIDRAWREAHGGRSMENADIDRMYARFLPLQKQVLGQHCRLIAGVPELSAWCREQGLKLGSTTGYTRELLELVLDASRQQGFEPDCALAAEDAPQGRPAPFLLYTAAIRLGVYPMWTIVKVDDTPVGVEAGRNAGCWTIGVSRTGNCIGLSEAKWAQLSQADQAARLAAAHQTLVKAGAHAVVESVADIRPWLEEFDRRLEIGNLPMQSNAEFA